ncbi:MAG: YdcF family protein [Polyangiaceae bacterium]|nr:YdcF family protein [Polyangiaceae bacterium]
MRRSALPWARLRLAVALACAAPLLGCGEESGAGGAGAPVDSGGAGDSAPADAPADAPFAAFDPALCAPAGPESPAPGLVVDYAPLGRGDWILEKGYYLSVLLAEVPGVREALAADPTLAALSVAADSALRAAPGCTPAPRCALSAITLTPDTIAAVEARLPALVASSAAVAGLVAEHLRPSGRFAHLEVGDPGAFLAAAWRWEAEAVASGVAGRVAPLEAAAVGALVGSTAAALPGPVAPHQPALHALLAALSADGRDEAARYEPLAEGENAAALAALATIDFAEFPFSAIVVLGKGPNEEGVALDPAGATRCDLAAARYAAGLAPVVLVSGGHVHPDRTPYAEAIEMKRYLREAHGVPEAAVLVDPHARHTTTNLRNATRVLLRAGAPPDQPLLVTTDFGQSLYVQAASETAIFGKRCLEELGYLPYRALVRLGETDTCMTMTARSLSEDGRDPLDP